MSIFDRTMGMSPEEVERLKPFGFAPGLYSLPHCSNCKEEFTGDKRSSTCRTCAKGMAAAQALIAATQPTREQKCADLARAIWPASAIIISPCDGVAVLRDASSSSGTRWHDFNPFTDHEACHALKVWLTGTDTKIKTRFLNLLLFTVNRRTDEETFRAMIGGDPDAGLRRDLALLTADPAIIAEAAWLSIQEAR